MILISAHLDRVIQNYQLVYREGVHVGLLDNFIGILTTYLALYDDPNLRRLEKTGKLAVWHGQGEEWSYLPVVEKSSVRSRLRRRDGRVHGRGLGVLPQLTRQDIALIVDVASLPHYKGKDFGVENISGFTKREIRDIREFLEWEGFNPRVKAWTGNKDDEDESWQWRKRGVPTMSFTIPIQSPNDGWHRIQQDSTVDSEVVVHAAQGLKRLICYLS